MRGKIVQVLKGYATDASDKPNTSIDYDRIDDLAESIVKLFAIPVVINQVCPKCKSDNTHSILNNEYSCFYCGNKFIGHTCL